MTNFHRMTSAPLAQEGVEAITEVYAQALTSFVPEIVKHALQRTDTLDTPYCETFYSAALFADVSGFAAMSQALASKGVRGTEELPQYINAYLGQIVRKIIGYGGDVVKFAGDALLCVWPPDPALFGDLERQQKDLEQLTHLATKCALDIQTEYGVMQLAGAKITENQKRKNIMEGPLLKVKLGIGAGKCSLLIVGGKLGRCEYLVCGDALMQAFKCETDCLPEQVVLSKQACEVLGDLCEWKAIPHSKMGNVLVTRARSVRREHIGRLNVTPQLAFKMKGYIPSAVRPHLDMPSTLWTGELREVTVLFISLPFDASRLVDLDKAHKSSLKTVQENIKVLQDVIYKYQGSLNKFLVDDKGSTVMAVFGLPPVAHSNDPIRAVLAALELQRKFTSITKAKHAQAALGLASGIVFSGLIGGTTGSRREYTVLGSQVNLAARLMSLAKKNSTHLGQVICDRTVYEKSKKEIRIAWTELGTTRLKGLEDPVEIFKPMSVNYEIVPFKPGNAKNLKTSDYESINKVSICMDRASQTNESQIIFVEGEISSGKSTLLAQVKAANNHKAWFLWGKADCFHSLSKVDYMVWRQVMLEFSQKFSLSFRRNRYQFQTWIKQRRPDLEKYLYLLADILQMGTDLEVPYKKNIKWENENPPPNALLCQYRHDLLICLLEWVARKKMIAVVIDEIQYLDIKDWQLTRRLALLIQKKFVKNIVLLLGGMPMDNKRYVPYFTKDKRVIEYIDLRNTAHECVYPHLWTWSLTKEWIVTTMDVKDCSKNLVDIIYFECGGRPGFCTEFLRTLKESSEPWIQILVNKNDKSDQIATFNETIEEKLKVGVDVPFPIPPYIQSITAAHLDCISTELMMCMKTAAVICKAKGNRSRQFEEEMLRGTHPVLPMADKRKLRKSLRELKNMGFIVFIDSTRRGLAYATSIRAINPEDLVERDNEILSKSTSTFENFSNSWFPKNTDGTEPKSPPSNSKNTPKGGDKQTPKMTPKAKSSNADTNTPEIKDSPTVTPGRKKTLSPDNTTPLTIITNVPEKEEAPVIGPNRKSIAHYHNSSIDMDNSDPMPSTLSLLQVPGPDIPYKKGLLYKRGVTAFNFSEKKRFFVFKHHSLYWFKDTNKEQYPVNRIKFSPGLDIKLKREDEFQLKVQTSRKYYVLRADDQNDMNEWYELFKNAMKEDKEIVSLSSIGEQMRIDFASSVLDTEGDGDGDADGDDDEENGQSDSEEDYSECHVYEFSYGFLRDVIYEQMLHGQRQQLHIQANKYIDQLLSTQGYDRNLALLRERHQELGIDKDLGKREDDLFVSHSKLKKKRQSKYMPNMYIQDIPVTRTTKT